MTKAHDKAFEILEQRGLDLTRKDLEEVIRLTAFFEESERQALPQLFEVIEQIKMQPDSNFGPDDFTNKE